MQRGNSFLRILVFSTSRPKFQTYILISNSVGAKISRWHPGTNSVGSNSDLRRNFTLRRNFPADAKIGSTWKFSRWRKNLLLALRSYFLLAPTRIYVENLHYVEIVPLAPRNLFPFGASGKISTLCTIST